MSASLLTLNACGSDLPRPDWYRFFSRSIDIHPKVHLDSYDGYTVVFKYVVAPEDVNMFGTLHGGAIATLADNLTTFAAVVEDRQQRPGVSVNLAVEYMIAPKVGETVTVECRCDKTGKYLSFSSATFYNDKVRKPTLLFPLARTIFSIAIQPMRTDPLSLKREMIAKASHTKFLGEPPKAKL